MHNARRSPSTRKLRSTRKLAYGLLAALLALVAIEGAARVAVSMLGKGRPSAETWYRYSRELGWERRPGFTGSVFGPPRDFDARGFYVADGVAASDPAKPRILALGDSVTFGYALGGEYAFPARLAARRPGAAVINMGVPGYSSYQVLQSFRKLTPLVRPALVIVSSSFNDRRLINAPGEEDGDARFRWLAEAKRRERLLAGMGLYRLLAPPAATTGDGGEMFRASAAPPCIRLDLATLPCRVPAEAYRRNLEAIAGLARQAGIPLIFLALSDNPDYTGPIERGVARMDGGDFTGAVDEFQKDNKRENSYSLLTRRCLARAYRKMDLEGWIEPLSIYEKPFFSLLGGGIVERDESYREVMREVAQARGVELADAGAELVKMDRAYTDFCHLMPAGHEKVAEVLDRVIAKMEREGKIDWSRGVGTQLPPGIE